MNVEIAGSHDPGWADALERLPAADVYHAASYHRLAEANGEGRALAFIVRAGDAMLFHPFLRRPIERVGEETIDGSWSDLESAYGYGGPLATTDDPDFLTRAWQEFDRWCAQERVVAEFVRFNPLLHNERFIGTDTRVVDDRETVVVDLTGGADALWERYPAVQRNMIRKARKTGLQARVVDADAGMGEFRAVYEETMRRVGADLYYGFSDGYFNTLVTELGSCARVVEVRESGRVAAACVLLLGRKTLHYHLSGSRSQAASLGATNLMLHEAATWGCRQGLLRFHVGGGRTSAPDDSLLRFKRSLSHERVVFRTGQRVHDRERYDELCSAWLRQAAQERPPYFLLYRLPVPDATATSATPLGDEAVVQLDAAKHRDDPV
jgi:hypothetical protein